jgi:hypothetical protein
MDGRYSTGTGIKNVKQRLERYYPDDHRFETHADNGRVDFVIVLPASIGKPNHYPQPGQEEKQGDTP